MFIAFRYFKVYIEKKAPIAAITLDFSTLVPKRLFILRVLGIVIITTL